MSEVQAGGGPMTIRNPLRRHVKLSEPNMQNDRGYSATPADEKARRLAAYEPPDLVASSSYDDENIHYPVLDIDHPCYVIPSQTPGHFHLYIDKAVLWEQYERLLRSLSDAGIIEEGYARASIARKASYAALRPWKDPK